ncbi:MAG TPA: glycosyltransferase family 2 protein [Rickettsiales bacterium]|nr:glycosyltransferase family 2 protein [Rickettsiales bacterium]
MTDREPSIIQLTIAIPTWNRADYLRLNLVQLAKELKTIPPDKVELFISDNASTDATASVVQEFIDHGIPLRYIRNPENIGSDHNIAQCFNEASGRYVLILGDDDLLIDGTLAKILAIIQQDDYGVIFLRPYGYNEDFRMEYPGHYERKPRILKPGKFIVKLGSHSTLISSCIIGKHLLPGMDARQYCDTNLVQSYLIYQAALRAGTNVYCESYSVACKRNNSGGYSITKVFINNFWAIIDRFKFDIGSENIRQLAKQMLLRFYPFYVWKQRLKPEDSNLEEDYQRFYNRFHNNIWFWIMIAPLYKLPRIPAIIWGAVAVTLGRAATGDAWRGIYFGWNALRKKLRPQ